SMASACILRRRSASGLPRPGGYCKGVKGAARALDAAAARRRGAVSTESNALDGHGAANGPVAVEAGLQRDERETLARLGVVRGQKLLPKPLAARERAPNDARRRRERVQPAERQRT